MRRLAGQDLPQILNRYSDGAHTGISNNTDPFAIWK
jgi:hypothetical protein